MLKLLFLGAGDFGLPTLERLAAKRKKYELLVITRPDRGKGRGRKPAPTPIREAAVHLGLPLLTPENINLPESHREIAAFTPDYLLLIDYGVRLQPETIALPRKQAINLHPSLLPAYRGPAPIAWTLIHGEPVTGVTIQLIAEKIDCGAILAQDTTFVRDHETRPELSARLSRIGAELVEITLEGLENGVLVPRPQDESRASRAPKLKKEDGLIDWCLPAGYIFNRIRGLTPWPGTYTFHRGKRIRILKAEPCRETPLLTPPPGTLILENGRLEVACGDNSRLEILELQPAGKPARSAAQFLNGYRPRANDRFSSTG